MLALVQLLALAHGATVPAPGDPCTARGDGTPCLHVPACPKMAVAKDFKLTNATGWPLAVEQTTARLCHDAAGLHVHADAKDSSVKASVTECGVVSMMNTDDVMEVFLAPVNEATDDPRFYHEIDTGASGDLWGSLTQNVEGHGRDPGRFKPTVADCRPGQPACDCPCDGHKTFPRWGSCNASNPHFPYGPYSVCRLNCTGHDTFAPIGRGLQVSVTNTSGGWSLALRIPWSIFPKEFGGVGSVDEEQHAQPATAKKLWPLWRLALYRIDHSASAPAIFSAWSPTRDRSFHTPSRFGVMVLV